MRIGSSKALIQMRDWCASGGRDTNSDRNHGCEAGDETCSQSEELQRSRLESRPDGSHLMSISSQTRLRIGLAIWSEASVKAVRPEASGNDLKIA